MKAQLDKIKALVRSEIDSYNVANPDVPITVQDVIRSIRSIDITLRPNQVEPVRLGIDYFKNAAPEVDIDHVIQDGETLQQLSCTLGISIKQLNMIGGFTPGVRLIPGTRLRHRVFRPAIIVAPTAFGKSILIAKIAENIDDKILIIQPNRELLDQNFAKFIQLGVTYAGVFSASFNSRQIHDVTYATIESIYKLGAIFKSMGFTKIIIDECHLYPRNMESMIGKFLKDSGITHVLGLSATPMKLQQLDWNGTTLTAAQMLTNGCRPFFKDILHVSQIRDMVEMEYWSKLKYDTQDVNLHELRWKPNKGEYTDSSLDRVYETNDIHGRIIEKLSENKDRKSVVVFVHSVDAAMRLENALGRNCSAAIYGTMPDHDRNKAIADFKSGKIRVIFNVNILSHGFDYPGIDCVITARPTTSISLYYQQLGRGVRIYYGKENCLIIDFSGNVQKFGKIEDLVFKKNNNKWELYNVIKQLTGVPIHRVGMEHKKLTEVIETYMEQKIMPMGEYAGIPINDLPPKYKKKIMDTFNWTKDTLWIREEIIKNNYKC